MDQEDKVRENRLRRMATRQGLTLEKSRRRDDWAVDFGKYRLVDHRNVVVAGASQHAFELTLDQVETYLSTAREKR